MRPTHSSTASCSPACIGRCILSASTDGMNNLPNASSPSIPWLQRYGLKLMEATRDGNVFMVKALLAADWSPLGGTDEGELHSKDEVTPLVFAIRHENVGIMHSIEAGASLDRGRDEDEMTPLGYAIETGNVKVWSKRSQRRVLGTWP